MSNRKKTRKQKIKSDIHRKINSVKKADAISVISKPDTTSFYPTSIKHTTYTQPQTKSYAYIPHDLLKTSILTLGIITGELLIFFLLKNNILKIPIISY